MRAIKLTTAALALALFTTGCQIEGLDYNVPDATNASDGNHSNIFDVSTDNSGTVKITPIGNGISKSVVEFGHGSGAAASAVVPAGGSVNHVYPEGEYTVTITSIDLGGKETKNTYPLSVKFSAPSGLAIGVSGGGYTLNITPEAQNASGGYEVYFGEAEGETPVKIEDGATATHTYAEAGEYTITVVALSGGAAKTTSTVDVTIFDPLALPINFDLPYTNYNQGGVFGGMAAEVIENPFASGLNTSSKVWKITKPVGAESWAGTWTPMGAPGGKPIAIDDGKIFKLLVYSAEVGKNLRFQLEDGNGFNPGVEVEITKANEWQELTFDFSTLDIAPGHIFNQFVVQHNLAASGEGEVFYIDNITQSN